MQSYFQDELIKLRKRIIRMFLLVGTQLEKSLQSVTLPDFESVETVQKNESRIDKLEIKIDKLCQRIFALAQPVATDLRFIMSSLRIGSEIERMGDIALDIIDRSDIIRPYQEDMQEYNIHRLFRQVIRLSEQASEAYTNNNSELAMEMITGCRQTEETCKSIFNDIISGMTQKSPVIVIATDLILIIRDLERISNHLENIADSIAFIVEGKRVRHAANPENEDSALIR